MQSRSAARAKINLYLHVGPLGPDGYHPIESLMTFADLGDEVLMEPSTVMGFAVTGPFASALLGDGANLVTRARDAFLATLDTSPKPFQLTLRKFLPVASGLGGGSADAAATLRLMRSSLAPGMADDVLTEIARKLGSDVTVCIAGRTAVATGRGDQLRPAPEAPPLDAVLVNPLEPSPTAAVYRAFDRGIAPAAEPETSPTPLSAAVDVTAWLRLRRNDLEAPAISLTPVIGQVLSVLAAQPEALLARMSGSGATCFALCANALDASVVAQRLTDLEPGWWVRTCVLGGGEKAS